MEDEMITGEDSETLAEAIEGAEQANDACTPDLQFSDDNPLDASDEDQYFGRDETVTTDVLSGEGVEVMQTSEELELGVESDPKLNKEDDDSPWGGVCDDKCLRCNVNSSKGYY